MIYKHPTKTNLVVVPSHNTDINLKTYYSILKQAGIEK